MISVRPNSLKSLLKPRLLRSCYNCKFSTIDEEYVEKPEYPPILDLSPKAVARREMLQYHEKFKRLNTVEEKLFAINMPRYIGWDSLILKEGNLPYDILPFVQYITKTRFTETSVLPLPNTVSSKQKEHFLNKVRTQIQEAVLLEFYSKRHKYEIDGSADTISESQISNEIGKQVVEQINRILLNNLWSETDHLLAAEIDYEPRLEAFWKVGGFHPDDETYNKRKKDKKDAEKEAKKSILKKEIDSTKFVEPDESVDHWIQYFGTPILQLRHSLPLRPLVQLPQLSSESDPATSGQTPVVHEVTEYKYDPNFYGFQSDLRHGTNIPGFWPGDPYEFGLLSYHPRGHMLGRPPHFGKKEHSQAVHAQAVLATYSWLLAQSTYQGFNTFNDLTYPLSTQAIITDGRLFSFYTSQLNTILQHSDNMDTNPKVNECYGTPTMELFERVDNGQLLGWNDEPLAMLISFYLNAPCKREGVNLKPYLDETERYFANIEDEKRRVWLHNQFRHLCTNRPRHRLGYEIYDWEYIYKIKFETRFIEARRRPFELNQDPTLRRYDDHTPKYVPKAFRGPKEKKKKFETTYYPDI